MNEVVSFLKKYQMSCDDINIDESLKKFEKEEEKGLSGVYSIDECSVPMIPTYLNPSIKEKKDKVIVIDAGGTNLRVGLGEYKDGKWTTTSVIESKMPGIDREYSKDEFFDYIAKMTIPYLDKAVNIGFCFSYRVAMDKDLDGTLIAWAKEVKASEVVGEKVGLSLLNAIKKYSNLERKIVVLNDTTAVLLGGMSLDLKHECDKYIGMIYGTGFNCCYIEENKNIKKIKDLASGDMIINTETGNFSGFNKGLFDKELALESQIKNEALTEKMTSGKYLATLIYKALKKATCDKLISCVNLPLEKDFDLPLVSMFLNDEDTFLNDILNGHDAIVVKKICYHLIERAAKLVATTVSSFARKSNVKKVGIIIEGSTFYKLPSFKESFEKYLDMILRKYSIEYKLFDGRNRILIGALMASMCK